MPTMSIALSVRERIDYYVHSRIGRSAHLCWDVPNFRKTGAASTRGERPKLFYPIFVSNGSLFIPPFQWDNIRNAWIPLEEPPSGSEAIYPHDDNGLERVWSFGWDRTQRESSLLLTARKLNDKWQIYRKYRPNQEGILPGTWWGEARYSASENGTKVLRDILGGQQDFSYPKSIFSVIDCLRACNLETDGTVLDYFAGSGTTAHATMVMNQEDGGDRRYILVEMGNYFDDVLKPRIQRIAYAAEWRDGKPVIGSLGQSHCFKYLRLESYEDTLNNLAFRPPAGAQMALASSEAFREDYTLRYMLDAESRDSLLNVSVFEDPFGYTLDVAAGTVGETQPVAVDLVETFNYLLGLRVRHVDAIQGYRVVQGLNPQGERVLVIWRNLKEKSNADLEAFFRKQDYNPRDMEFDLIYVNGDNHLENLRRPDETWKVRLIEEEFMRLMFDVQDL
jgi:adenine-specific DNA-methyltransferase